MGALSSSNWFIIWCCIEIRTLSIIVLIVPNVEVTLKYFVIQSVGSILLLIGVASSYVYSHLGILMLVFSLLVKLGVRPFHIWVPPIIKRVERWMLIGLLCTIQKIFPIFFLTLVNFPSNLLIWVAAVTVLRASIGGVCQSSLRGVIAYSSINHTGWRLSAILIRVELMATYFFVYIIIIGLTLRLLSTTFDIVSLLNLLMLGGLPPLLGFYPKWFVLSGLLDSHMFLCIIMTCTIIFRLFFYITLYVLFLIAKPITSRRFFIFFIVNFLGIIYFIFLAHKLFKTLWIGIRPTVRWAKMLMFLIHIYLFCLISGSWNLRISILFLSIIPLSLLLYNPIISPQLRLGYFITDNLSVSLIILTAWVSALALISRSYIKHQRLSSTLFLRIVLSLVGILIGAFLVNDFMSFFILFERALIPIVTLVLVWGANPERLRAGIYIFVYTIVGSLPLLLSLIYLQSNSNTLFMFWNYNEQLPSVCIIFLVVAFLIKLPIYGTHFWLPKAHVEAPVGASILLAGILLKLGPYGLLRIFFLFPDLALFWRLPLFVFSLYGAICSALICIRQTDIKALVAYASVRHISLTCAAIRSFTNTGWMGAKLMLIAHGLTRSGLFAIVNFYYENSHSRSLIINRGLLHIRPSLSFWWFLLLAANISVPPSLNFFAEVLMCMGVVATEEITGRLFIVVYSTITLIYSVGLYTSVCHGEVRPHMRFFREHQLYYTVRLFHVLPIILLAGSVNAIV